MRPLAYFSFFILSLSLSAQFDEVTKRKGVEHFSNTALLMGGGILSFDYNNDGNQDLYLTGAGNTDALYHNTGSDFVDISYHSNIKSFTEGVYTSGVISGDVNRDGCDDVFITTFDDSSNRLFLGDCQGVYTDVTEEWNLSNDLARSSGAVFLDFNNDGYLDLYVINYVKNSRNIVDGNGRVIGFDHECYKDFFYENIGGQSFAGRDLNGEDGCGLAVTGSDFDNDGEVELFVINDFGEWIEPNQVYSFDNGNMEEIASTVGLDIGLYGMGIASGDINGDGHLDYYITNLGRNVLLVYDTNSQTYVDRAEPMGVENTYSYEDVFATGWGTNFIDFDNDTDLDLFVANGYISAAAFLKNAEQDPNMFYRNDNGSFVESADDFGLFCDWINRSSIQTDFNNDGLQDLVVSTLDFSTESDKYTLLYENESSQANSFVKVSLKGVSSNPNAFGSRIEIWINGSKQIRDVISGGSHASQSSQVAHFGCGIATRIDSMAISWPSGAIHFFKDIDVNTFYHVVEDQEALFIAGCMDEDDPNFNESATINSGCTALIRVGCMDPESSNFDPQATHDSGECTTRVTTGFDELRSRYLWFNHKSSTLQMTLIPDAGFEKLVIVSLSGKKVFEEYSRKETISVEHLETGLYIAILYQENGNIEKLKFVK